MLNIAIDYDDTITADADMWYIFIHNAIQRGHNVYVVTWRDEDTPIHYRFDELATGVVYCNLKAKQSTCENQGIFIDIWIDDNPRAVLFNYGQ